MILVVYPSALEILKRVPEKESFHVNFIKNWAEENSIEYLNFYKIFNKYPAGLENYKKFHILCDVHWNEEGHKVVGEEINKYLVNTTF